MARFYKGLLFLCVCSTTRGQPMPQIETQAHSEIFSNLNGLTNPLVILTELEFNPEDDIKGDAQHQSNKETLEDENGNLKPGEKSHRIPKMITDLKINQGFNPGFNEYYLGGPKPSALDSLAVESKKLERVVAAPAADQNSNNKSKKKSSYRNYFTGEEPNTVHSDRSPYNFEPADVGGTPVEFSKSGIAQASKNDFVIKDHTYTMCPGCPTFSIPVPIPVVSLRREEWIRRRTTKRASSISSFFEKIGEKLSFGVKNIQRRFITPIVSKSRAFFENPDRNSNNKLFKERQDEATESSVSVPKYLKMVGAGAAAAVAFGGLAFVGTSPSVQYVGSRNFVVDNKLSH